MYSNSRSYSDVSLSKELVRIVRHGKYSLTMDQNGFVSVDEIISALATSFGTLTLSEIRRIVNDNSKKRFELKEINSKWMLKATQGHTVQVESLDLTLLTNPHKYETIVHGTRFNNWLSIKESGLSRMKRTHIHFAIGLPGDSNVISGMPSGCDVAIYIDVEKAMNGGISFYESSNKVILSKGDGQGCIKPKFFKKVVRFGLSNEELSF